MKTFLSILIGFIVYVALWFIITIFILGFNFGNEPFYQKPFEFFIKFPFGYFKKFSENYFLLMLILNGLFWSTIFVKGIPIIKRMILK